MILVDLILFPMFSLLSKLDRGTKFKQIWKGEGVALEDSSLNATLTSFCATRLMI